MSEPVPPDVRNIVRTAMSAYGNAQSDGLGRQWDIYAAMNFAEQAIMADRAARPAIDAETVEACAKVAADLAADLRSDPIDQDLARCRPDEAELFVHLNEASINTAERIAAAIRQLSPASQGDDT